MPFPAVDFPSSPPQRRFLKKRLQKRKKNDIMKE
jgi:hypothetical protein